MRIDLHGLPFNDEIPNTNGSLWYVTGMEGWDSPDLRQSFQDPTSRHGSVMTESMLGSRAVVLEGVVKSPNETAFWAAYNRLNGLTNNLFQPRFLKVYEVPTPKQVAYIRGGAVRMSMIGMSSFTFEVPLICPDPLKYASAPLTVSLLAGATATITGEGSFEAYPVVTMSAAGTFALENVTTGQRTTTGTNVLPSGTVIDFKKRTVMSGAVNLYTALQPSSVWWALQPGPNQITNFGGTAVSVQYQDAWI